MPTMATIMSWPCCDTRACVNGFPPAAIKLLLDAQEGAPFPVAPGVTLVVDPGLFGSGQPAAPLVARIDAILSDLLEEPQRAKAQPSRDD